MNAAKDCTLQEKLLRCAMALLLAAGALLASVAASPAYAAPSTVDVSIGGKIPYGGFATTWMSADGNIAYCAEPSSPTPAPGSYSTSPVPSGDVTAAIWYSFGSPGFDASMFPGSWYDGGGWDDAKYAAASHVLIAYAYSGSESAAAHGTSAEFASWAEREIAGDVWSQVNARANEVSTGFSAIRIHAGSDAQTLASFTWERGGVKIAKVDAQAGAGEQGDASLEGAEFAIVNASGMNSYVNGHSYADGETVMTISTSWDGSAYTAQTASDALPCGTYRIVEANAPEGYLPWEGELGFAIEGDGQAVDLSGDPVHDDAIRGGVQVTKADAELGESEAVGGNGHAAEGVGTTLSGIEFAITNASENKVLVGDAWYEPGEVVAAIETEWDEEIGSYIAKTAPDALPYGTYTIQETATNDSYLLTDGEPKTFEIRTDGLVVTADAEGGELTFYNQVVRNDLKLSKKAEDTNASLQVPFAIPNVATGETHVLVTDRNGQASTEASWNRHTANTNGNDVLLEADRITAGMMDPSAGIWFGLGEDGSSAPANDALGALPYGQYTLEELPCEANEGYELVTKTFVVERDSTVAKAVAKELGFSCLDTGAMYRAIAWRALQDGVALDDDLHHGGVQLVLVAPRGGTPFQITHVGPFVGDDERAFELSRTLGVDAEVGRQLHRTAHPFGNVAERSVGEDRRVERRIVVVGAGHHAAQVFLDEIGIVADRLRDRTEDDSLLGERLLESGLDRHGVHDGIDGHARQLHLLLQRDAQLVERAFEFGVDLVHGAQFGTHPGRSVIDDVLEIDLRNTEVRPRRRLHLEPVAVGPQARLGHPLRFALLGRDQAHDLLAQAARNRLGLDVGGETVLVHPAFYLFYDVILF